MFDINDKELIKRIIDKRNDDEYVIPLYVKIYNNTYSLLELDSITDYNPSSFKVGFGSSSSIFTKNSFITEYSFDFDIVNVFGIFSPSLNLNVLYNVFESTYVEECSDMHKQINYYVGLLEDRISKQVDIIKKELIRKQMDENT